MDGFLPPTDPRFQSTVDAIRQRLSHNGLLQRYEAPAGNIGINIGVAAPMAYFPFSGWKNSFFGDLHGQGRDAIEFYTDKKVVIERWAKEHSRKF